MSSKVDEMSIGLARASPWATFRLHLPRSAARVFATRRLHMTEQTDRIEKKVLLRAPQERVWRAISDAQQFGSWFGMELNAPFTAGARLRARIVPTWVDAEVAKKQEPYTGLAFDIVVERI